jgi:RNA recognition motif. (a.k.a. RRM, RBD, or RNP domain)
MSATNHHVSSSKASHTNGAESAGFKADELATQASEANYILIDNIPQKTDVSEVYVAFGRYGEVKIAAMVPLGNDIGIPEPNKGSHNFSERGTKSEPQSMRMAILQVVEHECAQDIIKTQILIQGQTVTTRLIPKLSSQLSALLKEANSRKMFVFGLKKSVGEEFLKKMFGKFGQIENVRIVRHRKDNRSKGFGFVIFKNLEAKHMALTSGPYHIHGKQVNIVPFDCPDEKKSQAIANQAIHRKSSKGTRDSIDAPTSNQAADKHDQTSLQSASMQPAQERDFQPEYKFNRSRIISSAAVQEYFRRRTVNWAPNAFSAEPINTTNPHTLLLKLESNLPGRQIVQYQMNRYF